MIAREHPLAERILSLVPINSLDPRLQDQVLAQGELLEFKKKKTVFEAGARDPYTFYLLDGDLELVAQGASPLRMHAGDENSRRALAQLQPRRYTATAISGVTVFRIERAVLDNILADEQVLEEGGSGGHMDVRELEEDEDDGADWMTRLLSSELFMRLPHENIQRFFSELEPLEAPDGTAVVEQGTPGDYLYIIAEGRCAVVRKAPGAAKEVQLAVLKEGDAFGEEALISNAPRNATVRTVGDGMLMRLSKRAFEELVSKPTLKALPWSEACAAVDSGARWLDVRFPDEHEGNAIDGSANVPLNALRLHAPKLDRETRYIVYCDTGARSSAGAFLLLRLGFEACYLAGGLERSPLGKGVPPAAEPQPDAAAGTAQPAAPADDLEMVADEDAAAAKPAAGDSQATPAAAAAPAVAEGPSGAAGPAPAPAPTPAPSAAPAAPAADGAQLRAALATLKAERDQAAAYGKKAAEAARELKRRYDELAGVLRQERARREALDKELAAAKADTQREQALEQTRLQGELDKALKRIETLQRERAGESEEAGAERERLQAQLREQQEHAAAVGKELEEARAARAAAEAAGTDAAQAAQAEAAELKSRVEKAERELAQTRSKLSEAQARSREAAQHRETQVSEVEQAVREAQQRAQAQSAELEAERKRLEQQREQLQRARQEAEARLREQHAALEKAQAAAAARAEDLERREADLARARESVDAELSRREQALTSRAEALARDEKALSGEKASWKATVEQAIAEERARVEADYARYREEAEAEVERRVEALLQERSAEIGAEHEAREAQMRAQVEAHVAKLLAEFDERTAKVRAGYETRLSEQEALAEDERRRLESEAAQLRQALADARAAAGRPADAAPDLSLDLSEPETPAVARPAPSPPAQATAEPDLELELDLQLEKAYAAAAAAPGEMPAKAPETTPALDLDVPGGGDATGAAQARPALGGRDNGQAPADPESEAEHARKQAAEEARRRVMTTSQLADLRKRMQEKLRAAKSRTG